MRRFSLFFSFLLFSCGSGPAATDGGIRTDGGATEAEVTRAEGTDFTFVTKALVLPVSVRDLAVDLDGDGTKDNRYSQLVAALSNQGLSSQEAVDARTSAGQGLLLITMKSTDSALSTADAVGLTLGAAVTTASPDFSGNGRFQVDGAVPSAQFLGRLADGLFSSNAPSTTRSPVTARVFLPVASASVLVTLYGAHAEFRSTGCPANPRTGLQPALCGQLHGGLRQTDVSTVLVPALAAQFTAQVEADPNSTPSTQLKALFDGGDGEGGFCTNADGSLGHPGDGRIAACEVASSALSKTVLSPDVHLFDDMGRFQPSAANAAKDSLSVGLGFELAKAQF